MASAVAAYLQTNGSDEPSGTYADFESAKCFFITGHTPSEAHPILMRRIWDRKRRDPSVKIIVCEPRKTKTSDIADLWLPIDPGTDLWVFHAMAHEIIKNGWHDKEFIARQVRFVNNGERGAITDNDVVKFDDYVKFLEPYTPEAAARRSKCPAQSIRTAAEWFANSGATMSTWCMGINQRVEGVFANQLIHNLHLITGNIHKPGADPFSMTGQPNACGGVRETGALSHLLPGCRPIVNAAARAQVERAWGVPAGRIDPAPGMPMMTMFGNFGAENDNTKPVKAILISTTNPAHSLPHLNKYLPGMRDGFLVVLEIFPSRTTQLADVVLPAAFLYAKGGVYGCSERRSQHNEKAVNPPGEARPDLWVAAQIARRMGHQALIPWNMDDIDKANEMAWTEYINVTKDTDKTLFGVSYARIKESKEGFVWPVPHATHPGTYKRYVRGMDPMFEHPAFRDRIPADVPTYFYMDARGEGRANVFLRAPKGPAEAVSSEFPFLLTTGRIAEQWHTSTMTGRVPEIQRAQPHAYVEIHPADARRLQIRHNDTVRITSRRGSNILPAHVVEVSLPGVVYVNMHDQHKDRMINFVCNDAVDPISNEPEYKVAAVRVERIGGPRDFASDTYLVRDLNQKFDI
jgi:nitrate reductase NapA